MLLTDLKQERFSSITCQEFCLQATLFIPSTTLNHIPHSLHVFPLCCVFATPRGHEAYLRTGPHYDFDHYRQLVHEITQAFCGISKEVLEIKEKLHHDFDRPDLSEHIEKLQSKEKQKLELVSGHFRVTTPLKHTLHVK